MTPERWQQIDKLFQAALELKPAERAAFLDRACAHDPELRQEVEALIASDEQGLTFIDSPAFEVAAGLLADSQPELSIGERIGHYKILSLLGIGGMGEVYLAQDTKLGRKIALKLLPADFTRDQERLSRFRQEARAVSALNHPNILTIHEISQTGGRHFIATEFIDGETLRQYLKRARLSLSQALDIAIQVASALAAAHETGIVHRDIKPENIMLRRDGIIKVLDFGLAKLSELHPSLVDTETPTVKKAETTPGMVMGTVKYMSPEQARGVEVDARSDIFSFGVVLYEMITGRAPFEGETASDMIAALLKEKPQPIAEHSPDAPEELESILCKALQKDKRERYQLIQNLLVDLKNVKQELELEAKLQDSARPRKSSGAATADVAQAVHTADEVAAATRDEGIRSLSSAEYLASGIRRHKTGAIAGLSLLFIVTLALGYAAYKFVGQLNLRSSSQNIKLTRVTTNGKSSNAAISPDGKYVAYVISDAGQQSLWIRQVATNSNVQVIPPNSDFCWGLTFSRDGNYLYFYRQGKSEQESALYQMPAFGGDVRKVLENGGSPVSFSPDGKQMAFVRDYPSSESAVVLVNSDGTGERKLAVRKLPAFFLTAAWSPDGKRLACAGGSQDVKSPYGDLTEIEVESGAQKIITDKGWSWVNNVAWLSDGSGLLIVASDREGSASQIWELPYPNGAPRKITTDLNAYSGLSLTADSSALVATRNDKIINIWTQPEGETARARQITTGPATTDGWSGIAWTPDGRIVYSSRASGHPDIWIMNADGTNQKQLTFDLGSDFFGLSVSPDGRYIVFVSARTGRPHIWRVDIDGSNPKQLTNGDRELFPFFLADGMWVRFASLVEGKEVRLKVPVEGGDPVPLDYPFANEIVSISPDGKLIAYVPPPEKGKGKRLGIIPVEGGEPIKIFDLPPAAVPRRMQWSADGRAVTYIMNQDAVSNIWKQPLDGSPPQQLTDFKSETITNFAWSRDGKQFAAARGTETSDIVLLRNFR